MYAPYFHGKFWKYILSMYWVDAFLVNVSHISLLVTSIYWTVAKCMHRNRIYTNVCCVPLDFCSSTMVAHGRLRSPNYPFYYGKDHGCTWVIFAEAETFAALNITRLRLAAEVQEILVIFNIQIDVPCVWTCSYDNYITSSSIMLKAQLWNLPWGKEIFVTSNTHMGLYASILGWLWRYQLRTLYWHFTYIYFIMALMLSSKDNVVTHYIYMHLFQNWRWCYQPRKV